MSNNQLIRSAVEAAERAETPYILFADDLGVRLRLDDSYVRGAIRQGWLGPWLTIDGEPAVTRDSLKDHLRLLMSQRSGVDRELFPAGLEDGDLEGGSDE